MSRLLGGEEKAADPCDECPEECLADIAKRCAAGDFDEDKDKKK